MELLKGKTFFFCLFFFFSWVEEPGRFWYRNKLRRRRRRRSPPCMLALFCVVLTFLILETDEREELLPSRLRNLDIELSASGLLDQPQQLDSIPEAN